MTVDHLSPVPRSQFRQLPLSTSLLRTLILVDLAVGVPHLVNAFLGRRFGRFDRLVDMDQEANLPTWIASTQWFVAAALLAFVAMRLRSRRSAAAMPMTFLAALFAALSLDETSRIHEKVESFLGDVTGIFAGAEMSLWLPVLGVIVLGSGASLIRRATEAFAEVPGSTRLMLLGLGVFAVAATVIEPVLLVTYGKPGALLVYLEETLELFGVSVMVAASNELALAHGLSVLSTAPAPVAATSASRAPSRPRLAPLG